jgi:tRNA modification GTPase
VDLVIVVLDRARPLSADDRDILNATASRPRVIVKNKSDLPAADDQIDGLDISATSGAGIDRLIDAIANTIAASEPLRDRPQITNTRHTILLERAKAALVRAASALEGEVSEEFPLLDLQEAAQALQEITGKKTSDDLLHHIFAKFCIGK